MSRDTSDRPHAFPGWRSSRRGFMRRTAALLAGSAGTASLLASCAPAPAAPTPAPAKPAETPSEQATRPAAAPPAAAPTMAPAKPPEPTKPAAPAAAPTPAQAAAKPAAALGAPKRGGTLTALAQNDWVSLDPVFETGGAVGFHEIFDTWVKWAKDPKTGAWGPQPALVAEWDLKPDQVVFKLQKGVKFHDGTPWDAKAAKWNLDRLIFHPQSRSRGHFEGLDLSRESKDELDRLQETAKEQWDYASKAIEVVDEHTVRLRLERPIAPLLSNLSGGAVSPISPTAHNKMGKSAFGRQPVGAGPFRFVEWRPGDRIVLERNPDYWRQGADGKPLPYLDKLVYRLIIDDSVRLLEVKSGNAQFMDNVQGKDVAGVKSDPNLVYVDTEEQGVSRRMPFDGRNPESPFVKHVDLRKALHYAIDRQTLGKTLGFELAADARYMFGKGSFAYDESAPFYAYDKAKAEQLVKGVLAKDPSIAGADGKINANISVISRVVDRQQAEIIKQMASVVGIELKIEILERAAFVAKLVQLPGKAGADYHVSTVQNPLTPVDPDNTLRAVYHSRGGQNYPHIGPFDELIDKAAATYDVEERKKVYRELAMKDYELALMAYMWFQKYNWLQNKKVKNVSEHIWGAPYFDDVWLE